MDISKGKRLGHGLKGFKTKTTNTVHE
jgi:hypothetical protein